MAVIKIGFIGASITAGTNGDPVAAAASKLTGWGNTVTAVNRAVGGTTTLDWQPGGTYLPAAKAAFSGAGVTVVWIGGDLGTNDAKTANNVSTSLHLSRMKAVVDDLVAAGYQVMISKSTYMSSTNNGEWVADTTNVFRDYFAADMSLVDGVNVFQGDTGAFAYSYLNSGSYFAADNIHPNSAANLVLGDYWAVAVRWRFGFAVKTVAAGPADGSYRGGFVRLPGQVTGLAAGAPTNSAVPLSWTAAAAGGVVATYIVDYRVAGGGAWIAYSGGATTGSTATVTGLTSGVAYEFRVTGVNSGGAGVPSAIATATTSAAARTLPAVASAAPTLWLDASQPSTLFTDPSLSAVAAQTTGVVVKGFADALGSGRRLVQAATGNAPTVEVGKANGRNMLRFTSSGSQMMASATGQSWVNALRAGQSFTVRLVWIAVANNIGQGLIGAEQAGATGGGPRTEFYMDSGVGVANIITGALTRNSGFAPAGTINHAVFRYDGTTMYLRTSAGGGDTAGAVSVTSAPLDQLLLGMLPGVNWFLNGWFGEFGLWPGFSTSAETDALLADAHAWWAP